MRIKDYLPILEWLPTYGKQQLQGDISAGLTVGVMLIPQGMAYAMLAGLPPIYGLYASTLPLIAYAIFGTSRQLAVGPVAMDSLLVAIGVGAFAQPGSPQFIELAILLALMVGAIQLMLGVFRLGFLVNFLSQPVISGFTSAAAIIIGLSQLKYLLGISLPRSNQVHYIFYAVFEKIAEVNWLPLLIGTIGILLLVGIKKLNKSLPGPLILVVLSILASWGLGLESKGLQIVGVVPEGLPGFSIPEFSLERLQLLLPTAGTISLIAFMEAIAVAKAIQSRRKEYKVNANQELIALGMANISGSFFRGYPVTGGFSRTAVNDDSGANTPMASLITVALILLTLLFLTPVFYYLPHAVLASVIMTAVFKLIQVSTFKNLFRTDRRDFSMMLVTFLATLFIGIQQGIAIGVVLSLIMVVFRSSYPHYAVLGRIPGTDSFRNINRFKEAKEKEGVLMIRFDAQLFFANSKMFHESLQKEMDKRKSLKLVIINAEAINTLDSSAASLLKEIHQELQKQGIKFVFAGVKGPVRDTMVRHGIFELFGDPSFYDTTLKALENFDGEKMKNEKSVRFQSNVKEKNDEILPFR